jgi:hypothetical protein
MAWPKAMPKAETIISKAKTCADELLSQAKSKPKRLFPQRKKTSRRSEKEHESTLPSAVNHSLSGVKQKSRSYPE